MDEQAMRAAVLVDTGDVRVREVDRPTPAADEVLVEVGACGVCMTDHHVYTGAFPARPPVVLGHESAGTVAAVGDDVTEYAVGDRVAVNPGIPCGHCRNCKRGRPNLCENYVSTGGAADEIRDGAFAEFTAVPRDRLEPVGDLPFVRAAFAEPLACVLHGVDRTPLTSGDRVVVVGAGPIGLLLVQAFRTVGAGEVVVSEPVERRRGLALELGADEAVDPAATDVASSLAPADVAVEAVGHPETVETALSLTAPGGTTLLFGVPPQDASVEVSPFRLYYDERTVAGSYAKTPASFARAVAHLRAGQVEVEPLVTDEFGLGGLEGAFERMEASEGLKQVVRPGAADE